MGPWVIPAASAAASAVQSYLASRGSKRGYDMSGYEKALYESLAAQLKDRTVPGAVTDPFARGAKRIEQYYRRQPGSSASQHGVLQREIDTPMAEASGQYLESREARIQALMASLARGTGTQTFQGPMDIGSPLQDIGWAIWMATHGKNKGAGEGAGGGLQYSPGFLGG